MLRRHLHTWSERFGDRGLAFRPPCGGLNTNDTTDTKAKIFKEQIRPFVFLVAFVLSLIGAPLQCLHRRASAPMFDVEICAVHSTSRAAPLPIDCVTMPVIRFRSD